MCIHLLLRLEVSQQAGPLGNCQVPEIPALLSPLPQEGGPTLPLPRHLELCPLFFTQSHRLAHAHLAPTAYYPGLTDGAFPVDCSHKEVLDWLCGPRSSALPQGLQHVSKEPHCPSCLHSVLPAFSLWSQAINAFLKIELLQNNPNIPS